MNAVEFKFLRALLNMGSLKDISKATGVSIYEINSVLKGSKPCFCFSDSFKISALFNESFEHSITNTGLITNDLKAFYPLLVSLKYDKYGSGYRHNRWGESKNLIKTAFLHTLDRYDKAKTLKKSSINGLKKSVR